MAVQKATTTKDVVDNESASPTLDDLVQGVVDNTDSAMVADVDKPKTVKLKSPAGFVTEVPQDIVDVLKDSGYTASK